jgi:uncharacterized protein (TIGR02722 family)
MKSGIKLFLTLLTITGLSLTGCASTNVAAVKPASAELGSSDLRQIAVSMVDSMVSFPPLVEMTSVSRPLVSVDRVKNRSVQSFDAELVTDSIRTQLIRSGKFRFVDRSADARVVDTVTEPQQSDQGDAEFLLISHLSETRKRAGNPSHIYYVFTMSLKNMKTGMLEWSDETVIRKELKYVAFGG